MLAYLARTVPAVVRSLAHRDGSLVSRLERRVLPSEIDTNLHMNQAAYLRVGELGRLDLVFRSRILDAWREAKVRPVVAEQRVTYRRELKPLQRYALDTRMVRVEGRLLWFEAYLLVGDRVHARLDTALISVGPDGVISKERAAELAAPFLTEALPVEDWRVVAQP